MGVFEGEPLDFTRPASSADNAYFRDANRLHERGPGGRPWGRARAQANADGIPPKIPLCGAALVQMMESADVGFRDNPSSLTPRVMFTATLSPTVA